MSLTASQKFAVLSMPVAAIGLAVVTSDPEWNTPRKTPYGSQRELQRMLAAPPAAAGMPTPPEAGDPSKTPAPDAAKKDPAAKPATRGPAPSPSPSPPPVKIPSTPPAAKKEEPPTVDSGVEFRTTGLVSVRFAEPLRAPQAERLDVFVQQSGDLRVGTDFLDADGAKERIRSAEAAKRETGLLYVVPNARAPWEAVKDMVATGFEAGWGRVGLCVSFADDAGKGRLLVVHAPSSEKAKIATGLDAVLVKIGGVNPSPSYTLNGAPCTDPAGLAFNAKAIHDEYEVMEKDYSVDIETTPWTLDTTGASAGGVISALDALTTAGVKTVRILGLTKPAR